MLPESATYVELWSPCVLAIPLEELGHCFCLVGAGATFPKGPKHPPIPLSTSSSRRLRTLRDVCRKDL